MFQAIRIQNFRNINDSGWVELTNLMCLSGLNESGKSNFLDAFKKLNTNQDFTTNDIPITGGGGEGPRISIKDESGNTIIKECSRQYPNLHYYIFESETIEGGAFTYTGIMLQDIDLVLKENAISDAHVKQAILNAMSSYINWSDDDVLRSFKSNLKTIGSTVDFVVIRNLLDDTNDVERSDTSKLGKHLLNGLDENIIVLTPGKITRQKNQHRYLSEDVTLKLMSDLSNELDHLDEYQKYEYLDIFLRDVLGDVIPKREMKIRRDKDNSHMYITIKGDFDMISIPVLLRSEGMRKCIDMSILMNIMKPTQKTIIIDEPENHLHPGAQGELLKLLKERSKCNTIIYATHSPFMVNHQEPESFFHITNDKDGFRIQRNINNNQKGENKLLFQQALGMQAWQHYLISEKNLIVEGVDDLRFINLFSQMLTIQGEDELPLDVLTTPVNGASHASGLALFFKSQGLQSFTILDGDQAGKTEAKKLQSNEIKSITLNNVLNMENASIEDFIKKEMWFDALADCLKGVDYSALELIADETNFNSSAPVVESMKQLLKRVNKLNETNRTLSIDGLKEKVGLIVLKRIQRSDSKTQWVNMDAVRKLFKEINDAFSDQPPNPSNSPQT